MDWRSLDQEQTEELAAMTRLPGETDEKPVAPEPTPVIESPPRPEVRCPSCGTPNDPTRTLCSYCGNNLRQYTQATPSAPPSAPVGPAPPRTNRMWLWVIGLLVLGLVVVTLLVVNLMTGGSDPSGDSPSVAAYKDMLAGATAGVPDLVEQAQTLNDTWDEQEGSLADPERNALFDETEQGLQVVAAGAASIANSLLSIEPPDEVALTDHQAILDEAARFRAAADAMIEGLNQPRGEKQLRLDSLRDFIAIGQALLDSI